MSGPRTLSFLPDDYLERKAQTRTNVICATLLLLVMGAAGVAYYLTQRAAESVQVEHAALVEQYEEAAGRIARVQKMQDQQKKLARQAELTASLLEKLPRSLVLAELTNALPAGASLLDLKLSTRKRVKPVAVMPATRLQQRKPAVAEAPEPEQVDVKLEITGIAHDDVQVSKLIASLGKARMFRDVNLLVSEEHNDRGEILRRFKLEMQLDESAPLERPDTAAASVNQEGVR